MSENDHPSVPDAPDPRRKSEREQFFVCPVCGERVDWRDQEEVMRHASHGGQNGA